ncbi:TPA: nucleoside-triphosphatase [Providencia alcalifaciens]
MINRDQKIIITGGPGAGKSTIIEKLSAKLSQAFWYFLIRRLMN